MSSPETVASLNQAANSVPLPDGWTVNTWDHGGTDTMPEKGFAVELLTPPVAVGPHRGARIGRVTIFDWAKATPERVATETEIMVRDLEIAGANPFLR